MNGIGFLLPVSLQLAYWKVKTGRFLIYSYSGESFQYIRNPKILEVLFSDAKGLFIFCPVLIFFLIGLLYLGEGSRKEGRKEIRAAQPKQPEAPGRDQSLPRSVRDRAGGREESSFRSGVQSLQAHSGRQHRG